MGLINSKRIVIGISIIMILVFSSITFYSFLKTDNGWIKEVITFESSLLDDEFEISIALPPAYDPSSAEQYHTVYLLDSQDLFDEDSSKAYTNCSVLAVMDHLLKERKIPNTILVGISFEGTNRERYVLQKTQAFLNFFQEELIPYIENNYNVIPTSFSRTLLGWSATAQFTIYALLSDGYYDESTFTRFVGVSGAYDNSRIVYQLENNLYSKIGINALSNNVLYMTVGTSDKNVLPWGIGQKLLDAHRNFAQKLEKRGYKGLILNSTEHEGYGHYDIPQIAMEDGLEWVFKQTIEE
jgi:enterochelin esterase-like enzyme